MELFVLTKEGTRVKKAIIQGAAQEELDRTATEQLDAFLQFEESYDLDAQYKLDPHEVFKIEDFVDLDNTIEAVNSPASIESWDPEDDPEIKGFFFSVKRDGKTLIGFQTFDRRQVISNKFTLAWSRESFTQVRGLALSLDNKITALLESEGDNITLYFKSLHNTRRLFEMDMYFKEATQEDVNSFFQSDIFSGYEDTETNRVNIDSWCRKKISFILSEDKFQDQTADTIKEKADELNVELNLTADASGNNKITFPEDRRALKKLLRFLDEDIWRSPITGTIFVASSKRKG